MKEVAEQIKAAGMMPGLWIDGFRANTYSEVFIFPAMDKTVPLDFRQHGKDREDGFELLIARHGEDIYLGIFNWCEETKGYNLPAFGSGLQSLEARHSKVFKYSGNLSFKELSRTLSSGLN
jgi:alpha-galactosidase